LSGMVMPCITDHLVLRTVDGAADLLVEELRAMSSIHSVRQPSADTVECTIDGSLDELAACALYSTIALRDPSQSLQLGLLGTLPQPVKFRVGVDDPERRRTAISATEQRFGWVNRPGD
jgi:tRNA (guanine6-N2)-methyltransferase